METETLYKGEKTFGFQQLSHSSSTASFPSSFMRSSISTPVQIQNHRLDELFKACDTKERGVIGPEEFRDLCKKFGISCSDSDAIFIDLDHDGDGFIDFEDFSYGFKDFLTPGSRRGSLQISCVGPDQNASNQQLLEMEKKHASARTAWKHFMNNVGPSNIQPFISSSKEQLFEIVEEIKQDQNKEVSPTLEKALTSLIMDVQHLHEEYKTLETTFRKEREVHAAQLVALGEELDQQLAKAEAKAKAEARQEAQRQMDAERKKIASEIENQLADLSSQIRTFQKVEEWLSEEEAREKRVKAPEDQSKLYEAESENRNLKSALAEAQMKATLLQTQLTQRRNEYLDLFNALHTEKQAASEYKSQVDLMQNHLVVLSEANRVLSDANDCLSTKVPLVVSGFTSPSSCSSAQQDTGSIQAANSNSCPNSLGPIDTLSDASFSSRKQSMSDPRFSCITPSASEIDRDSGRSTLLDEIRAEGDGSPLPSGIWTCSSSSTICNPVHEQVLHSHNPQQRQNFSAVPHTQVEHEVVRSKCVTSQIGNNIGKIGSSCCTENIKRNDGNDEDDAQPPKSPYCIRDRGPTKSSENTYRSFEYGEGYGVDDNNDHDHNLCDGDENHLGNGNSAQHQHEESKEKCFDPVADSSSSSSASNTFYPHRTFKVILAGDAAVGKTTFIERICHGHFTPNLSSTIGVDFRVKTIELDGKLVALQMWDTAGQERFRSLTKSYFRRADGIILMYDVSNERTFANIRNWIQNVEEGAGRKVPIILSGNKVDLRDDKCQRPNVHFVSYNDGVRLASQCGAIFMETSPKTGRNVFEALMLLATEMSQIEDAEVRNSLQLSDRPNDDKLRKKGCCSSGHSHSRQNSINAGSVTDCKKDCDTGQ